MDLTINLFSGVVDPANLEIWIVIIPGFLGNKRNTRKKKK